MYRALFVVDQENGRGHQIRSQCLWDELATREDWQFSESGVYQQDPSDFDLVIVDDYRVTRKQLEAFSSPWPGLLVVVDDYQPARVPSWALLVNGTFLPPGCHSGRYSHNACLGPNYAIIRREFREIGWHGGSGQVDLRNVYGLSATELARLMAAADSVTVAGGMRCQEAACVGVPEINVVVESDNQVGNRKAWPIDGLGVYRVADEIMRRLSKL